MISILKHVTIINTADIEFEKIPDNNQIQQLLNPQSAFLIKTYKLQQITKTLLAISCLLQIQFYCVSDIPRINHQLEYQRSLTHVFIF